MLLVRKRKDRSVTTRGVRLSRIIVGELGWKEGLIWEKGITSEILSMCLITPAITTPLSKVLWVTRRDFLECHYEGRLVLRINRVDNLNSTVASLKKTITIRS